MIQVVLQRISAFPPAVMMNPADPDFQPDRKGSQPSAPRTTVDPPRTPLARPTVRPPGGAGDSQSDLLKSSTPCILPAAPDHSATLTVGKEQLVVSGSSPDLVRIAKIVLHEYFIVCGGSRSSSQKTVISSPQDRKEKCSGRAAPAPEEQKDNSPLLSLVKPELSYEKAALLELARSPLSKETPDRWSELVAELPGVVRRSAPPS